MLVLFLSPLFILGENAHIRVHDNLDSNLAWYKVLVESGQLTGDIDARISQVINGELQRNAFGTEFSLIVWLYALFPTMTAYALSQAITRIVAFGGMYLLLKKHFTADPKWAVINVGVSLAFSMTPFWPSGMLSTLGMPLALWAFLNIRSGENSWKNYLVLTLLPLYSSIVLGFFFFLSAMGLLWLVDGVRGKGWNWAFLLAIAYMTIIFMLVEYRLVYSFLFDHEPNSRDEYFHARLTLGHSIKLTFKNYFLGHNHVLTIHTIVIQPVLFLALIFVWIKKRWEQERTFLFLFILNFVLSAWYAFWFYKGWLPLTERFHFLDTFNFARYHFLRPLIIYVLFAVSLRILWQFGGEWKKAVPWLVAAQIILLVFSNEEIVYHNKPSVKEFFAEEQFGQIKDYIGLDQEDYRVASLGLHPAIAQYNGFYTLDTYNNFYPLTYKYKFRKIIEKELAKNKTIRTYFDEWGGRCYLFTDELGKHYMFKKNTKRKLENLELNMEPFKEMGGRYLLSSVPIENASENGLVLDRVFDDKRSAWKIHLYKAL
ncbi:membrane protein [Mesobacillus campisalis]|uniref:Membrane protein n=2 Tax=Mesobacillus campisalis TaxID=1408103 RepID=A0A0M2T1G3_9BACI|nr:membrane protein [Mesobacillus campisalis]